ncbi:MAG: L-rhamnose mutarotase [Anaerolineae bacterium]|nr:L-rhamnose mutarotase [Anaerolineae bacterium]
MNRVGFILQVKARQLGRYKSPSQQVWPEMLAALSATGWHNYSLFVLVTAFFSAILKHLTICKLLWLVWVRQRSTPSGGQ